MPYDDEPPEIVVERSSGGGHITVFVIGLVVGAGAALLLAPQSGAETREEIARQAKRVRRGATQFAEDVREHAEEAIDTVKTHVVAGREAGKTAARAARDDLRRRLADAQATRDDDDE